MCNDTEKDLRDSLKALGIWLIIAIVSIAYVLIFETK